MILWLRDLVDRYDQLSLRERAIILAALLVLLFVVWQAAFIDPLDRERKQRLLQVESLRAEVAGLEQGVEAIVAQGVGDPDRQNREAIAKLNQEIAALDARLAGATSGLIAPKEMAQVLEQLLARTSQMTLHSLRTLPPEAVMAPGSAPGAPGAATAQIYRHGVELELGGTYLETLNFLQALETLPWRFFWDRIEFRVENHPQGRLRLVLFTIGLQEGWIGV